MESGNNHFTPERVDEQIERLHLDSVPDALSNEAQLVNALHRYYSAPALAEDHAALERARQRVLGNYSTGDTFEVGNERITSPAPVAPPRSTRLIRIVSSFAAVILVGTLVGGWFAVTHRVGTSPAVTQSTPSTPSGLYVVQKGIAYRLDASSGRVIWQHRLVSSRVSTNGSLQVANGVVYVVLDFDVYAIDARNGKQIWHATDNSSRQGYSWFQVANGRVFLYNSSDDTFSALNAADGSLSWHNTTVTTSSTAYSSVLDGNLYTVFTVIGDAANTGNNDGTTLYRLDGATGKLRWKAYLNVTCCNLISSTPLVANGVVYVAAGKFLFALNERTGKIIWQQTVPSVGGFAPPYIAHGVLYVVAALSVPPAQKNTEYSDLFAYNAQTGQLLWAAEPGYSTLFNLPVTGGLLIAPRTYNGVYSIAGLDAQTGRVAWQVPFQCSTSRIAGFLAPNCDTRWVAIINGKLYVLEVAISSQDPPVKLFYTLKSFNPRTGQLLSSDPVTFEHFFPGDVLVVGASHGLFYAQTDQIDPSEGYSFAAYRLGNGSLVWSHAAPIAPPSANPSSLTYYSQVVVAQ
jgi:outer membrane protein assembly factor BamB